MIARVSLPFRMLLALTPLLVTSCGGDGGTGNTLCSGPLCPAASVEVTVSGSTTLSSIGATVQLQAVARDASGGAQLLPTFAWSSSDENVITVDQTGLATAVAAGTADVSATTDNQQGSAVLVVDPAVGTIEVTPVGPLTLLDAGETLSLAAVAKDTGGSEIADV